MDRAARQDMVRVPDERPCGATRRRGVARRAAGRALRRRRHRAHHGRVRGARRGDARGLRSRRRDHLPHPAVVLLRRHRALSRPLPGEGERRHGHVRHRRRRGRARDHAAATRDRLAAILSAASRRNGRTIYLLSDEAYHRILFDGRRYESPTESYPPSILIYTYGKQLLTPGERIGYLALPSTMPSAEREQLRGA